MDDTQFIAKLAQKLRRIRADGLATQKQIEAATGVIQETISKVLNGKRRRRNDALERLDKYANMLLNDLSVPASVTDAVVDFLTYGTEEELVTTIRFCARLVARRPPAAADRT